MERAIGPLSRIAEYEGERPMDWPLDGTCWRVVLSPSEEFVPEEEDESECLAELLWMHTPSYPSEAPRLKIRNVRGLRDSELDVAIQVAQRTVEESMGMAMIFQVVSSVKEWLRGKVRLSSLWLCWGRTQLSTPLPPFLLGGC